MSKAGGGERRNKLRSRANEPRFDDGLVLGDVGLGLAPSACDLGRFVVPPLPETGMACCVIKAKCSDRTRF
jgi:hypothetical protein